MDRAGSETKIKKWAHIRQLADVGSSPTPPATMRREVTENQYFPFFY